MLSCAMDIDVDEEEDVHYSTEDLFELVWQANKRGGAASGSPPSEDAMAAWLYPIVSGHQDHMHMHAGGGDHTLGRQPAVAKEASSKGMKKAASPGSASSCRKKQVSSSDHYSRAHNLTEKKRRCRINEKLRTLQRLVPGCDKSNQVSTLEQTIQYMKSLQQQVLAMNTTCRPPPPAMYPAALAMPTVAPAGTTTPAQMVPFLAMLPYPHYQAMITPAAAAAGAPQYPPGGPAHHTRCSVSMEQHQPQQKKEKEGRRL